MSDNWKRRMDSYIEGFKNEYSTNEDITIEKMIDMVSEKFNKKWYTSYKYNQDNIKDYKGSPIPLEIRGNIQFRSSIAYIATLYDFLMSERTHGIDDWVLKEVEEWEIKGGNCIYFSTLLYALLVENEVCCPDCINYVQGMYKHEIREDYPSFLPWNGTHHGLHAWITIGGSIIDIAIRQQECFFDFANAPLVFGKAPEGLIYKGYEETAYIVQKYVLDFSKFSNMPYPIWIRQHNLNALDLCMKALEDIKRGDVP